MTNKNVSWHWHLSGWAGSASSKSASVEACGCGPFADFRVRFRDFDTHFSERPSTLFVFDGDFFGEGFWTFWPPLATDDSFLAFKASTWQTTESIPWSFEDSGIKHFSSSLITSSISVLGEYYIDWWGGTNPTGILRYLIQFVDSWP